ncbi:TPA: recombination protein NinG [Klebsiella quasipneumoniae subsp. similipneumoniae]|nr:recombination protein NinG [Klebsiella quasipneumoniae subsp. similipneumoniae]
MAKRSRRKCAHCREWFYPAREGQTVCCFECASAIGKKQAAKAREAAKKKALLRQREVEKESRQRRRAKRIELKTKSQWRSEAQTAFNKYVRLRDAGKPCISCGRLPEQKLGGTMDCGHYRTRGAARHLSFNLHNTAAQCVYCNRDRAGAQKAFEQGLIQRIGPEAVDALNNDNTIRNFDIPYLQRVKSIFIRKARALEKRRTRRSEAA